MGIRVFGLTGGIATGKSTVSNHWRKRGLKIIDADEIARRVVEPGTSGIKAIIEEFGEAIAPGEILQRSNLRDIVFSSAEKRKKLDAIMKPLMMRYLELEIFKWEKLGAPVVCYDAALICEHDHYEWYKPLVMTYASRSEQIQRITSRNVPISLAEAMIDSQMPSSDKAAMADFIITTSGLKEETMKKADIVLDSILLQLKIDPALYKRIDPIKVPHENH